MAEETVICRISCVDTDTAGNRMMFFVPMQMQYLCLLPQDPQGFFFWCRTYIMKTHGVNRTCDMAVLQINQM
jgi:hypothetical protein